MGDREHENECLLAAISLLNGDVGDSTQVGDLRLVRDGDRFHVNKAADDVVVFVDTLRPAAFPSARVLGAYLRELDDLDAAAVDLPESPREYVGPID